MPKTFDQCVEMGGEVTADGVSRICTYELKYGADREAFERCVELGGMGEISIPREPDNFCFVTYRERFGS